MTTEVVVAKREFHAFLSHAHVDRQQVDQLYRFLSDIANIRVWYDAVYLPPGATVAASLFQAIENSRAAFILLSRQSVSRGWVQQEYQAAINHQTKYPDFRVVPLRLDDVEPPDFLQNYSNLLVDPEHLDPRAAAHIVRSLYQPGQVDISPDHGRHVYVSRGWHPSDLPLAERVSAALSSVGLRSVGDAPDQLSWREERVGRILDSCGAFVAVLPRRATAKFGTSEYVLREWELAAQRGLPCLAIPDPAVVLPAEFEDRPGLVKSTDDPGLLTDYAVDLSEQWRIPLYEPYIFYATDFGSNGRELRNLITESIEATTGLACRTGEYVQGSPVQNEILQMVTNASVLLADVSGDSPNVYVEIGAARAAGVPVALMRKGDPGRPVFMLRDHQVYDYQTDAEALGRAIRASYPYRRFLE